MRAVSLIDASARLTPEARRRIAALLEAERPVYRCRVIVDPPEVIERRRAELLAEVSQADAARERLRRGGQLAGTVAAPVETTVRAWVGKAGR